MSATDVFVRSWLIGFCIEGVLYGLQVAFFACSFAFLTLLRRSTAINHTMLIMTIFLFTGSTVHFAHDIHGYVTSIAPQCDPGSVPLVGQPGFIYHMNILFSVNDSMGVFVLIYRCWLVWEKRWLIISLPLLLFVTFLVSTIIGLSGFADLSSVVVSPRLVQFGKASFSISLVLNILLTLLIAGRLLFVIRRNQQFLPRSHTRQYSTVIAIFLESGAIFSIAQLVFIILWTLQLDTALLAVPIAQIYCIVPTLIIVGVGLGRSLTERHANQTTTGMSGSRGISRRTVVGPLQFAQSGPTATVHESIPNHEAYELDTPKADEVV